MDAANEACPVCLETMSDDDARVCKLPGCEHRVHVACMLAAAQYDVRCPLCRQCDASIARRSTAEEAPAQSLDAELHQMVREHERRRRLYSARRARAIRGEERAVLLRDRLVATRRELNEHDRVLSRAWLALQRTAWREDQTINELKRQRALALRRFNRLNTQLDAWVADRIGPMPRMTLSLDIM